jgi:ubiquinone/menaquinone biosynthesis C-methylase UbiE
VTEFVCPECASRIEKGEGGYNCGSCSRFYPILFGIPDFRVRGDLYLMLEDERAKAARLDEFAAKHDFRELVAYYYSITNDVPDRLAAVFAGYLVNAPLRARPSIEVLRSAGAGDTLLDLGCGSGGALVAAADVFQDRTGVDIALRWLVIARKRLEEAGATASLVCADAEALPFPKGAFTHVLAADLLESTRSPAAVVNGTAAVLENGGHMYVTSSNSLWVGPHPATGVWFAGLLPARVRSALLRRRHGVDILRAVSFVSPGSVRRMGEAAGLRQIDAGPLAPEPRRLEHRSALFKAFAWVYAALAKTPVFRSVLCAAGPVFQSMFAKEKTL